jgi:hypothetical protein
VVSLFYKIQEPNYFNSGSNIPGAICCLLPLCVHKGAPGHLAERSVVVEASLPHHSSQLLYNNKSLANECGLSLYAKNVFIPTSFLTFHMYAFASIVYKTL